jgi:hypothetical protein
MVTPVDGVQKRIQVCLGPRLACGGHEHERQAGAQQPSLQGLTHAVLRSNRNDSTFDRSPRRSNQLRERLNHARSPFDWQVGEHHDPDSRVRHWIAPLVFAERVVAGLGRGHTNSRGGGRTDEVRGTVANLPATAAARPEKPCPAGTR